MFQVLWRTVCGYSTCWKFV